MALTNTTTTPAVDMYTPAPSSRIGRPDRQPPRMQPLMRKYEVAYLSPDQSIQTTFQMAPANELFEDAFAAFVRGTLLASPNHPIAIEDLEPGDVINTRDAGPLPVQWVGKITLVPNVDRQRPDMSRLTRVSADSFGLGRPMPDLMLGAAAHLLQSGPSIRALTNQSHALVSARSLVDWENLIEVTPPTPVTLYHLAFDRHAVIWANGLEVESCHPGHAFRKGLTGMQRGLYLSLFPQIELVSDFGPYLYPRISQDEIFAA